MKRSELKNIVKELVEAEIGQSQIDPETGIKSTLTNIDPETGRREWDIEYGVDPKFIYNKLDQLVSYLDRVKSGSDLDKIAQALRTLKNQTSRLIK